ncbi:MAG: hypothetical protein A07HR60_02062 [uncultured archaeon A07HR60]|nr:MAG: hypothetical protein A07HR60_02062 [uncultured archaeon A07HR60]
MSMVNITIETDDDGDLYLIRGEETVEKEVKPQGNGAHVIVPKAWTGSQVKITRVTDPDSADSG